MDLPSSAHIIYIPMVLLVGVMLGFIFGSRAARNAFDMERKRDAERAEARARRQARKEARAAEASGDSDG
ncbi:MAG: hypothetical protein Tsb0020_00230 [Haliangiales bacterium]